MSKSRQSKTSCNLRRLALAACLASVTGCTSGGASLASLNPFAKPDAPLGPAAAEAPGVTEAISGFAHSTRAQAGSMGMALKSAYGKGRESVSGLFGGEPVTETDNGEKVAQNDPLLLKNAPTSVGPEVFVANGQLWESTGNLERAMDNYTKALEKEPNNGPALASIARLNYRQQRYDQAVEFFQRAIVAVPNEAGLYNDLGLTLSKMGRHDEAIKALGNALAVAPGTSRYANNLATVQFEAGREDEARATLVRNNKPAVAHYNMAYLLHSANRNDQALKELAQVLAMSDQVDADSASQRAVQKSKELFEKLGGPASQIAQSLPQIYGAASGSTKAVAQLAGDAGQVITQLRDTTSGVSAKLSDSVVPASGTSGPVQSNPAATQVQTTASAQKSGTTPATTSATMATPAAAPYTNPLATAATKPSAPDSTNPPTAAPASPTSGFSLPPDVELPATQVAEGPTAAKR